MRTVLLEQSERLKSLRYFLSSTNATGGVSLIDKALIKAESDDDYSTKLASYLRDGGTLKGREVFSCFGRYLNEHRQSSPPYYPHTDAVNSIDGAMLHVKNNDVEDAIEFYRIMSS